MTLRAGVADVADHRIMTDPERATLRDRLALDDCAGMDDAAAAAYLSAQPMIDNPEPPRPVPKPWTGLDLIRALPPEKIPAIKADNYFPQIMADIRSGSVAAVEEAMAYLRVFGLIDDNDVTALRAVVEATIPDPAWPPKVPGRSWAQATYGDRAFAIPNPHYVYEDGLTSLSYAAGQVMPEMVAEARTVETAADAADFPLDVMPEGGD